MLISRVADHCFWFGRYLERAEATARSLASTREALMGAEVRARGETHHAASLGLFAEGVVAENPGAGRRAGFHHALEDRQSWLPVIIAAGEESRFVEIHPEPESARDGELVQEYMVWELRNPSSLRATIQAVRWNARTIREHLSAEVWEHINGLHWWMDRDAKWASDRHAFYNHIARTMALIAGLLRTTMLRDEPLDFIILGTMLERAGQTARILDVQHHALELSKPHVVVDTALWLALLRACGGYEPFMRRHRGRVSGHAVAAFLVQDPRFPRSIGFALEAAAARLDAIRQSAQSEQPRGRARQRLVDLHTWLAALLPEQLIDSRSSSRGDIHQVLTRVVDEVHAVCADIAIEFLGQQ